MLLSLGSLPSVVMVMMEDRERPANRPGKRVFRSPGRAGHKKAPAKLDSPADAIPCLSFLGPLPAARVSQVVADLEPDRTV